MSLNDVDRRPEDALLVESNRGGIAQIEGVVRESALAPVDSALPPVTVTQRVGLAAGRLAASRLNPLRWMRAPTVRPEGRPASPLIGLARSFAAAVLLPTAIVGLYLFVIASDQYVVEARFAVRGITEPLAQPGNLMTPLSVGTGHSNNQDGFIVANYIESLALVRDADRTLDLKGMFSRGSLDVIARFDPAETPEELARYWRKRVTARIDAVSGIVTLEVRAFSPEDAVAIATFIVGRAEALVNDISRRARETTIARNKEEVEKAEARLRTAHLGLQTFRNRWGIIDPAKSAEATLQTLVGLRREKLKLENDLQVLRGTLDERARSVQTIVASLHGVDAQIAELQSGLTSSEGATKTTNVTQAILEYEGLVIERTIAEKIYESAQNMLDRSRVMAEKQQVYLATFVPPSLPEDSLYPRRWTALATLGFCFFVLWTIGALIAAGVRDHRI